MSTTIYVEHANKAFRKATKDYKRLIDSIKSYPEVNHEQFNVEIHLADEKGSNTSYLFIYGYKISINMTLILGESNEYLGRVLCRLANEGEQVAELYIDEHGSLKKDESAEYPSGYLGDCGKENTATKFLKTLAKNLLNKKQ